MRQEQTSTMKAETFNTYKYQITGGDIRFGKELTPNLRADLLYKLETIKVSDVAEEASFFYPIPGREKARPAP